ncbi:dihydrofolate synthase/folylpolyglutamate synthase [Kroppenstedtia sanguinis]|uniref:tetrahydrofolate synthase n=1 Tax=Kroppenstedtia sanguinis TaxID=1380684 RepID=A0ABW4CA43_9BACL
MADAPFFSTTKEVFDWMEVGCTQGIRPGLERMEWVLERLNHPERRLKFIHIAGTNGKGSTAAMVSSVLQEAGYPVGMFTSPYLHHWGERITLDGEPIPEKSFIYWADQVAQWVEEMDREGVGRISPFEFWTLVAILYFAKEAVPWFVVWETGLGGRLDSTNVVYPLVSVITNVGHDHTHILGGTLTQIAEEKAGIIKPGVPVITACEEEEALSVLSTVAEEKQCRLYRLHQEFDVNSRISGKEGESFSFSSPFRPLDRVQIPLRGKHQVKNGAVALMTLEILRKYYATVLEEAEILKGMEKVRWPGRLEEISQRPSVWLDGAHNPEGAEALAQALRDLPCDRLLLLTAVLEDKDATGILKPLLPLVDRVIVTQVDQPRGLEPDRLREVAARLRPDLEIGQASRAEEGLHCLLEEAGERDCIVVAGTLFLVSEIRESMLSE